MKVTLGSIEFEARPHKPKSTVYNGFSWEHAGPLGPLDSMLFAKYTRKVFSYDCNTGAETRFKLEKGDILKLETDIKFWVPSTNFGLLDTAEKKSRSFGNAVIARSGLGSPEAFNTALQGQFASFPIPVPIDAFRSKFRKNTQYAIYALIRYQHYLLTIPGKRLKGSIAVSYPLDARFWGFTFKPCESAKGEEKRPREVYEELIPLMPDSIEAFAITAEAHERRKKALQDEIKERRERYKNSKKEHEKDFTEKTEKKLRPWFEKYREEADRGEKGLKDFEDALSKQKAKLQEG